MKMKRLLVIAAAALTLVAQAQNFPGTKPISIVVPFAAGGRFGRGHDQNFAWQQLCR